MYEQFYGLEKPPFSLTPDPRFLYMTEAHQNARAGLMYSILSKKGFSYEILPMVRAVAKG